MLGTFIQALFTMSAALTLWGSGEGSVADNRGDPFWTNVLSFLCVAFLSLSMGLQGIMAKRLDTYFAATGMFPRYIFFLDGACLTTYCCIVVLTTTWVDLMGDYNLFRFRYSPSRDHKIMAITTFFVGGFVGRCMVDQIGSVSTLSIITGLRVLIALSWYLVPSKPLST